MPLIVSSLPGRIRVRHKILSHVAQGKRLRAFLLTQKGVKDVEHHADTLSLIVRYDTALAASEDLERVIDERVTAECATLRTRQNSEAGLNRIAKYGMLFALAGTLLALLTGKQGGKRKKSGKRVHARFGGLFVAFLLLHLYCHRQRLLA